MKTTFFPKRMVLIAMLVLVGACGDGTTEPTSSLPVADGASPTAHSEAVPTDTPAAPAASPSPTATATAVPPPFEVPGCENVTAESYYCLTLGEAAIQVVGLDSGDLCPVAPTSAPLSEITLVSSSIARLDGDLFVCSDEGLLRISIADGSWEIGGASCNSVAAYDGGLLVDRYWVDLVSAGPWRPTLTWYSSYDDVRQGTPTRVYQIGGHAWAMTTYLGRLYKA